MTTVAYLSGPMNGVEGYNYPAFNAAAAHLRELGLAVFNPAESFEGDSSLAYSTYLRHDLQVLSVGISQYGYYEPVDMVVVLPGWERAAGAVLEVAAAAAMGLDIVAYDDETGVASGVLEALAGKTFDTDRERLTFVLSLMGSAPSGPEPLDTWEQAEYKLLDVANETVFSNRSKTYGSPFYHHRATAQMWSAFLTRVNGEREVTVRPSDVSLMMVMDKVSRAGAGDKPDSILDIAGYAACHALVRAEMQRVGDE